MGFRLQRPHDGSGSQSPIHEELAVDKVALRRAFLQTHRLPLSLTFHQYSKLICICKTCLNESMNSSSLWTFQQMMSHLYTR